MERMKKLWRAAAFVAVLGGVALAQQFTLPPNSVYQGHLLGVGDVAVAPPTGASCTIAAGSTDTDGNCATTSTSGSITFTGKSPTGTTGYLTAPNCIVVDASSTTVPPTYTVSTTAITLSTIITAHTLFWHCTGKVGG